MLKSATDEQITDLLANPEKIHEFLNPKPPVGKSWFKRTFGVREPWTPGPDTFYDLMDSWQIIHFLLTGIDDDLKQDVPFPDGFITSGGIDVGEEDVGYGPARTLSSNQVKEIDDFLRTVSMDDFRSRIRPQDILSRRIYRAPLVGDEEGIISVVADFGALKKYVSSVL